MNTLFTQDTAIPLLPKSIRRSRLSKPIKQPRNKSIRKIPLSQGKFSIVDAADYEWLMQWVWSLHVTVDGREYAARNTAGTHYKMHRFILGITDRAIKVDHRNHDGLDNRRTNLRICDDQRNSFNSRKCKVKRSSRFKGVHWHNRNCVWISQIQYNGAKIYLGSFERERKAAKAYDAKAVELFGDFANVNFNRAKK